MVTTGARRTLSPNPVRYYRFRDRKHQDPEEADDKTGVLRSERFLQEDLSGQFDHDEAKAVSIFQTANAP